MHLDFSDDILTTRGNVYDMVSFFTLAGAKELLRLGILTITIPTGCAVVGSIVEGIIARFSAL